MQKFFFFVAALVSVMFMTSCNGCSAPAPEDDDVVLITSSNFEDNVAKIDSAVRYRYPEAVFFEAESRFVDEEGNVDPQEMLLAYGSLFRVWCLVCTVQNDTLVFTEYNDNWAEDMVTTPYVSLEAAYAVKLLKDNMDILVKGAPMVLRHQLYYNEPEPRFFIGTIRSCHTVNVYTGIIDQPLGLGDTLALPRDAKATR